MRLDKFLSESGLLTRKEAAKAAKSGRITVNGLLQKRADLHINEESDTVCLDGSIIPYRRFDYIWLNKPEGYVSATEDGHLPCVTELLPPPLDRRGLFPCGRLDKDTTGLLLLTNDGGLSHLLLSPKRHVSKEYRFTCTPPLPQNAEAAFSAGMKIDGGELCKPARLVCDTGRESGIITLTEGKYHQIKRMTAALGSTVTSLERISFAGLPLPATSARGEIWEATEEEIAILRHAAD